MFRETIHVHVNADFGQGDIIEIIDEEDGNSSPYGVIINADCDLENKKTDGQIALLPMYPLATYLERYCATKYLDNQTRTCLKNLCELCKFEQSEFSDLQRWLAEDGVPKVFASLTAKVSLKKNQTQSLEKLGEKLTVLLNTSTTDKKISALFHLDRNPLESAKKYASSALTEAEDSHFFFSDLIGREELGYLVRLRRIFSLPRERCYQSYASFMMRRHFDARNAIRVGKLAPTYQYKLLQRFSHQFSRIGIPNEMLSLEDIVTTDFAHSILGG